VTILIRAKEPTIPEWQLVWLKERYAKRQQLKKQKKLDKR